MAHSANYHGVAGAERMELSPRIPQEPSSSADEWPHRPDALSGYYGDTSPLPSPNGAAFYQQHGLEGSNAEYTINSRDSFNNDKYGAYSDMAESQTHLPKEASYGSTPSNRRFAPVAGGARQKGIAGWSRRKKILIGGGSILVVAIAAIIAGVVYSKTRSNSSSDKSNSSSNGNTNINPGDRAGMSLAEKAAADKDLTMGGNGTVITAEDGSYFQYNSSYGGYWVSTPFDDSARVRSDVPALNETWDFSRDLINGVNLGGWLNLEPFITPGLFEPFNGEAVDEYTLSSLLGDNLTAVMTEHYETFITEIDFARIAEAGLNWIRLPVPFWFIETYEGESYLEGVGWQYFLKALAWARKYGIRVELDLHTVPGSANGQNHSGRIGSVGFLNGVMGVVNAQRTISYIQTLIQFVAQPQYQNVVAIFHPINEPYATTFGEQVLRQFYLEAYESIRNVTGTGQGNGPMISLSDGFLPQTDWYDFLPGADRVALETHYYLAFSPDSYPDGIGPIITRPCQWWSGSVNTTYNEFGFALGGEWSLATNDCGQYLNGVGLGARYDGSYANSTRVGSCDAFIDASQFSDAYKLQLRQLMRSYQDGIRNWFFWTWKIGTNAAGLVANPLWSYQLGLELNYIPVDPRPSAYLGACAANAAELSLPGQTFVDWTPPLAPSMTGGAGAGTFEPAATESYTVWPPVSLTNFPDATTLPRLTATGTPVTMPATPFPTPAANLPTGGWANTNVEVPFNVRIPGCSYLNGYSGVGVEAPPACTAA